MNNEKIFPSEFLRIVNDLLNLDLIEITIGPDATSYEFFINFKDPYIDFPKPYLFTDSNDQIDSFDSLLSYAYINFLENENGAIVLSQLNSEMDSDFFQALSEIEVEDSRYDGDLPVTYFKTSNTYEPYLNDYSNKQIINLVQNIEKFPYPQEMLTLLIMHPNNNHDILRSIFDYSQKWDYFSTKRGDYGQEINYEDFLKVAASSILRFKINLDIFFDEIRSLSKVNKKIYQLENYLNQYSSRVMGNSRINICRHLDECTNCSSLLFADRIHVSSKGVKILDREESKYLQNSFRGPCSTCPNWFKISESYSR